MILTGFVNRTGRRSKNCSLPYHLRLGVFKVLLLSDLANLARCSRTCKRIVYATPEMYADVDISRCEDELNDIMFKSIMERAGRCLRRLDLEGCVCSLSAECLDTLTIHCPNLAWVDVRDVKFGYEDSRDEFESPLLRLHLLHQLQVLFIVNEVNRPALISKSNKTLRNLSLHNERAINTRTIDEAGLCELEDVGTLKGLARLAIYRGRISWSISFQMPCLTELRLVGMPSILDVAVRNICSGSPNLHSLDLSLCMNISGASISELVSYEHRWREIVFCECYLIEDEGLCCAFAMEQCHHWKTIEVIDLSGCFKLTRHQLNQHSPCSSRQ